MRDKRALWMLAVSVLMGLAVVVLSAARQDGPAISTRKVLVAASDLELGTRLQTQLLTAIDWPQTSVPDGTFSDALELKDRVLKTSLQRGEAVLSSKLAAAGSGGGLSAIIAGGKRAMTVRVNDVVGVAGFALPGNHVDVLMHARQERGNGNESEPVTRTVLENVLVLAVAQEAGRDDTKPRVVNAVTLELSPAEAEKIDLARNIGALALVLRNQIDRSAVVTPGISKRQLLGEETAAADPNPSALTRLNRSRPKAVPLAAPLATTPVPPLSGPAPTVSRATCVEVIQAGMHSLSCF